MMMHQSLMLSIFTLSQLHTGAGVLLIAYLKMISVYIAVMALFEILFCTYFFICIVFERKRSDVAKEQNTRRGQLIS